MVAVEDGDRSPAALAKAAKPKRQERGHWLSLRGRLINMQTVESVWFNPLSAELRLGDSDRLLVITQEEEIAAIRAYCGFPEGMAVNATEEEETA